MMASQISAGEENDLRIRIYGTEGGLEWRQEEPNYLFHKPAEEPERVPRGQRLPLRGGKEGPRLPAWTPGRVPPNGSVRQRLHERRRGDTRQQEQYNLTGCPGTSHCLRRGAGRPLHREDGGEQPQRREVVGRSVAPPARQRQTL